MSFLHPTLAAIGLACVALPIVIHILLRRRRKPMQWGAMRFVLEAYKRRRRRTMLEQILLLLLRCLLVALLALGIASPSCSNDASGGGEGSTTTWYLLDNSIGSSVQSASGATEFTELIATIRRDIERRDAPGERAGLILMGAEATPIVVPPSEDKGALRLALTLADQTDARADIAGSLSLVEQSMREAQDTGGLTRIMLLSGWREGSLQLDAPLPAIDMSGVAMLVAPPADTEGTGNASIAAVTPRRAVAAIGVGAGDGPEGLGPVSVVVRRAGPEISEPLKIGVTLTLTQDDQELGRGASDAVFASGQAETVATIRVATTGERPGAAMLTARLETDAIESDNVAFAPVEFRPLRVGLVDDGRLRIDGERAPAAFVRPALEPESIARAGLGVEIITLDPTAIFPERLAGLDAVIAPDAGRLSRDGFESLLGFTRRGGLLLIAPTGGLDVSQQWTGWLSDASDISLTLDPEPIEPEEAELSPEPPGSLLAVLTPEWDALSESIGVARILRLRPTPGDQGRLVEVLASIASGEPYIATQSLGESGGRLVLFTSALDQDWSSLPLSPLLVPVLQELIRAAVNPDTLASSATVGSPLPLIEGVTRLELQSRNGEPITLNNAIADALPRLIGVYGDTSGETRLVVNPEPDAVSATPLPREQVASYLGTADPSGGAEIIWLDDDDAQADAAERATRTAGELSLTLLAIAAGLALLELGANRATSYAKASTGSGA